MPKTRGERPGTVPVKAPHRAHRFLAQRTPDAAGQDGARGAQQPRGRAHDRARIERRRLHQEKPRRPDAALPQQMREMPGDEAAVAVAAENQRHALRQRQHFLEIALGKLLHGGARRGLALRMQQVHRLVLRQERRELVRVQAARLEIPMAEEEWDGARAAGGVDPSAIAILQHSCHAADAACALPDVSGLGLRDAAALLGHALLQHRCDAPDGEARKLGLRIRSPGERFELEQHLRGEERIAAGLEEILVHADVISQQQPPPQVAHLELEQVIVRPGPGQAAALQVG
jgi:hypothetical protein